MIWGIISPRKNVIELIFHGAMKAFTDPVCLGMVGFCLAVINIFHGQIQLIAVTLNGAAIFRAPIC